MSEDLTDEELADQHRRQTARRREDERLTDLWEVECAALMNRLGAEEEHAEARPPER